MLRLTFTLTTYLIICLTFMATTALASGWHYVISSHPYGPKTILAIDKSAQTFFMLHRRSPLQVTKTFPCTTGQLTGDKQAQGDLRTPEGVYFIEQKVGRKLDWDLYGGIAYTLNYPNPIDRLKGKTGSGIWLHGRGKQLAPRDTRGCVALNVLDIKSIDTEIAPGTPIVITSSLSLTEESTPTTPEANSLVNTLKSWAKNWQEKSNNFFAYYDNEKLTQSEGRPFSNFVDHKRNVFASQPWIQVMVENIHAVQGPDYWVTWFDQYYRAPSLTSQVGKRFYWQKNQDGQWRIVGREYTLASEDLSSKYMRAKTVEVESFLASWTEAWQEADIPRYVAHYAPNASQGKRRGIEGIAEYKRNLWYRKPPVEVKLSNLKIKKHPQGLAATFSQTYEDGTGYRDTGAKTLILTPAGEGWSILSETWRRL